jgi:hypothetical protein
MSRVVPAVMSVLALAGGAVLTGCGDDEGSTGASAPATTTATAVAPATTAPAPAPGGTTTTAPDAQAPVTPPGDSEGTTTLEAPDADPAPSSPTVTSVQRPSKPVLCPSGAGNLKGGGEAGDFDTRELLGLETAAAKALARKNGCAMRVVNRDGEDLIRTMDFSNSRINVTETKGRIVALNGIG